MKNYLMCIAVAILLYAAPAMAITKTPEQLEAFHQADVLERQGAAALRAGDMPTAEANFRASVQAMSEAMGSGVAAFWIANYGLAEALTGEGRVTEAIQVYQQALLPPKIDGRGEGVITGAARLRYVLLLDQTGQWAEAVQNYEYLISGVKDPDPATDPSPSLAIHFDPAQPAPRELAAMAHVFLGLYEYDQRDKALDDFGKALQLAPNSDLTNYYYGYGLQQLGRTAQASAAFQKTIKIAHGDVKLAAVKALKKLKAKPA